MSHCKRAVLLLAFGILAATGHASTPAPVGAVTEALANSKGGKAAVACQSLQDWERSGKGKLVVEFVDGDKAGEVKFHVTRGGVTMTDSLHISNDDISAIVSEDADYADDTVVCADRWFILDLPAERGGILVAAQLLEAGLAMSRHDYEGDDEDAVRISWRENKPWFTTNGGGTHALTTDPAAAHPPKVQPRPLR